MDLAKASLKDLRTGAPAYQEVDLVQNMAQVDAVHGSQVACSCGFDDHGMARLQEVPCRLASYWDEVDAVGALVASLPFLLDPSASLVEEDLHDGVASLVLLLDVIVDVLVCLVGHPTRDCTFADFHACTGAYSVHCLVISHRFAVGPYRSLCPAHAHPCCRKAMGPSCHRVCEKSWQDWYALDAFHQSVLCCCFGIHRPSGVHQEDPFLPAITTIDFY